MKYAKYDNHVLLLMIPLLLVIVLPDSFAVKENKIDTEYHWTINSDEKFNISLIDNKYATPERIEAIEDTIFSTKQIVLPDILMGKGPPDQVSIYYLGWSAALNSIKDTKIPIPKKLSFDVTKRNNANITIELSNMQHPEKFVAYAVPMIINGDMVKSKITIYNIQNLKMEQLKTILRHELGHGFGIDHSTDPKDLMFPEITTFFPYISPCVIHGIESLYNGNPNTQFVCEK